MQRYVSVVIVVVIIIIVVVYSDDEVVFVLMGSSWCDGSSDRSFMRWTH